MAAASNTNGIVSSNTSNINNSNNNSNNNNNNNNNKNNDDSVCDNWEQLDSDTIEKRLQSIKVENDEQKILKNPKTSATSNTNNQAPTQTQPFKILKRPQSNNQLTNLPQTQVSAIPAQPIKTFEQREQEYAQARLRILGSAHPDDDNPNTSKQNNNTNNNANCTNSNSNYNNTNGNNNNYSSSQLNNSSGNSNSLTNMNNYNNYNNNYNNNYTNNYNNINNAKSPIKPNKSQSNVTLIREPYAPDGTRGFNNTNTSSSSSSSYNTNNSSIKD